MNNTNPPMNLPEDVTNAFSEVAGNIGRTHRALGLIVDEYIVEFVNPGQRMVVYQLFADLYRQCTGETISARQIRYWRKSAVEYHKHELVEYQSLTDSQLTAAIELAETANVPASTICEWAVQNDVHSVPPMYAHWLPQTGSAYEVDDPAVSSLLRFGRRRIPEDHPLRGEFDEIVERLRQLIRRLQDDQ